MKQQSEPLGGRHLFQVRNRVIVQANDEENEIMSSLASMEGDRSW